MSSLIRFNQVQHPLQSSPIFLATMLMRHTKENFRSYQIHCHLPKQLFIRDLRSKMWDICLSKPLTEEITK